MKQLERLKTIYNLLNQEKLTKDVLFEKLNKSVSTRQITRDLKDIRELYLRADEEWIVNTDKKAHSYHIKKNESFILFEQYRQSVQNGGFVSVNPQIDDILDKTNFYELKKNESFQENFEILYRAISSETKIFVSKIKYYATAETDKAELQDEDLELIPVKIMYHRGDFYLCSFYKNTFRTDKIGQMTGIKILEKKFNRAKQLQKVSTELEKRFGITKNINKEVYEIKLQFSSATGTFVKEFRWHPTQNFETLEKSTTKDVVMTLYCGINRELVGWVFQWMSNVKIISPPELVALYDEMLEEMRKNKNKDYVPSTNIFNK
ncbi:MAG: WYL domain-containing protein [Flavobacteriaceae bacterium]